MAWSCGANSYGAIGTGSSSSIYTPVQILTDVEAVFAGYEHSFFIKTDNTLWACGANHNNDYADDSFGYSNYSPVQISSGVASAYAGDGYSFYITTEGDLYAIGYNQSFRLGTGGLNDDNLTDYELVAEEVEAVYGSEYYYSLIKKTDGTVWGAGSNYYCQFGNSDEDLEYTEFTLLF